MHALPLAPSPVRVAAPYLASRGRANVCLGIGGIIVERYGLPEGKSDGSVLTKVPAGVLLDSLESILSSWWFILVEYGSWKHCHLVGPFSAMAPLLVFPSPPSDGGLAWGRGGLQ